MKITIFITFFFFFNSSIVYSKIITFKNCFPTFDMFADDYEQNYRLPKKFDKNLFEEVKYEIDLEKKEIRNVVIITDNYLNKRREYYKKQTENKESLFFLDAPKKIDINKIPLTHIEKKYIVSIDKSNFSTRTQTFYLNEKKIDSNSTDKTGYNFQGYIQCE